MVKAVGKKPKMRRNNVQPEEILRDGAGNVTMIRFYNYEESPLAPTIYVSKVGGLFRYENHLIRVTLIDDVPNARGSLTPVAQVHVVWKTPQLLLEARERMSQAMEWFQMGVIGHDGPYTRQ